jgi:hypothetical protein
MPKSSKKHVNDPQAPTKEFSSRASRRRGAQSRNTALSSTVSRSQTRTTKATLSDTDKSMKHNKPQKGSTDPNTTQSNLKRRRYSKENHKQRPRKRASRTRNKKTELLPKDKEQG